MTTNLIDLLASINTLYCSCGLELRLENRPEYTQALELAEQYERKLEDARAMADHVLRRLETMAGGRA